jgi:CRP-like cAMP-binding protein
MIKMLRIFRKSSQFKEWINTLNISVGLIRMVNVLISMFFLVHLMACFWYMAATLEENLHETWVGGKSLVDASASYKYWNAFYWAFQTVTTVGYGDFSISTTTEYILALIWMVIGVNFYSFTIGNVSSIIANLDAKAHELTNKIQTLNDYSAKYRLPQQTHNKIRKFFENSAKTRGSDGDWEALFQDLPPSLRTDVIQSTHGQIIDGIKFFKDKPQDFLINLIPRLKPMTLYDNDILFNQGDQAEEIFFVYNGSVLHYVDILDFMNMEPFIKNDQAFNVPLCLFSDGSYFGDNEVLLQKNGFRMTTAICQKDSQIYAIKNNSLEECLDKYVRIRLIMIKIAEEKNKYYSALREEIKLKYKSKREQEKLIKDKKGDEWTYHMSRKRQQVKKSARLQS